MLIRFRSLSSCPRLRLPARWVLPLSMLAWTPWPVVAQEAVKELVKEVALPDPTVLPAVVVTGSLAQRRLDRAPYAVSVVEADALRVAGPRVNLSEALVRVPGITANHRQNHAQDLQLSSRGFGARAPFGVRGLRLYTDGIPATMPDGQGQVSHFDLASARRLEVLRGPFSALYGQSAGGVLALVSEPLRQPVAALNLDAGSGGLRQWRLTLGTPWGRDAMAGAGTGAAPGATPGEAGLGLSDLRTDGERPHSQARRQLASGRLAWRQGADEWLLLVNHLDQRAQDPLGLSRAQWLQNPDQTTPQATQFNTRKNARQTQAGLRWTHRLAEPAWLESLNAMAYAGTRRVQQWQAIAPAAQASPSSGGGVVDFSRRYDGLDLRLNWRLAGLLGPSAQPDGSPGPRLATGLTLERQRDDRQGYENFIGTGASQVLGVTGALRRNEDNRARTQEAYAQLELPLAEGLELSTGLRAGRTRLSTRDAFLSNGDDSGALQIRHVNPVLGLGWALAPGWLLHAAWARGSESPTLNELAYRPDGLGGFNTALRPQKSRQQELGLKWRGRALALDAVLFQVATQDEIAVQANTGGRAVYQNVGRTRRSGLELAGHWQATPAWRLSGAASTLQARYRDTFLTCAGTPCPVANLPVPAGGRVAGTNGGSAFLELAWRPGQGEATRGMSPAATWRERETELALEWRAVRRTAVNDANTEWAPGYGLLNLRMSLRLNPPGAGAWGRAELVARLDNLAGRRYVGSVIVNDGNSRFFEPAPGRSVWVGLRLALG